MYIHLHVHLLPWRILQCHPMWATKFNVMQGNDVHIFNHTPLQILAYAKTCRFLYIYIYTYEGFLKWGYHFLKQPMLIGFSMLFSIQLLEIPNFKNPLGRTGGGSNWNAKTADLQLWSAIGTPRTKNTRYIRYIRYIRYKLYYIYMLKIIGDNDSINQERLSKRPSCVLYAPRGRTICI